MEQPGLAADERYKTHNARGDHQNELDLLIENWCRQYDSTDVLARLESASVPAGRIYRAADMFADPHFADREAIMWMKDPKFGDFPMQNVVPKLSTTPGSIRTLGPELGEQNQEVYGDLLGLDAQALDRLRLDGVI
jgi:formyl-CoA transferase